jgi:hypothetical protein
VQAAARVLVEDVRVRLEVGDQRCAMRVALGRLAQAVEFQAHVTAFDQSELAQQRAREQDLLGVDVRAGKAHRLDVELVELAITPLLRPSWRNIGPIVHRRSGPL